MRIRISHEMAHRYAPPARMLIQNLRLTPHGFDSQYVLGWRIDVDLDGAPRQSEDVHGNIVTSFSHHGTPLGKLIVSAAGEVETTDAAGVVRGAVVRLPPEMYLRDSPLAHVNGALREFAAAAAAGASDSLDAMHRLMAEVHRTTAFEPDGADSPDSAVEAFALRRGQARDLAHIFIACARFLGVPARFIGG
jgi:transglutaminase-like putative cysteine protease